jgi:hypothetical protein
VTLITDAGAEEWPRLSKSETARRLAARIAGRWRERLASQVRIWRKMKGIGVSLTIEVLREDWADPEVPLPDYATAGAAGADLRANLPPGIARPGWCWPLARGRWCLQGCAWRSPRGSRCRCDRARGWR